MSNLPPQKIAGARAEFEKKIREQQFYEAHQVAIAAAQRYVKAGDLEVGLELLHTATRIFLDKPECHSEAADVLNTCLEHLRTAWEARKVKTEKVGTELTENTKRQIHKLADLFGAWVPRTHESAIRKIELVRNLMKFSSQVNNGPPDEILHKEAAYACHTARDFMGAIQNFAAARCPSAASLVLGDWVKETRIPDSEIDLLITRSLLQFLLFRDIESARIFREECANLKVIGPVYKASPLYNFSEILIDTLSKTQKGTDRNASIRLKDGLSLVQLLLDHYAPALAKRDPELEHFYFAHIKHIYFHVPLPKRKGPPGIFGGMDMGKMMQMASNMMQRNPNMMQGIAQMMMKPKK